MAWFLVFVCGACISRGDVVKLERGISTQHVDARVGMAVEASSDVAMVVVLAAHVDRNVHSDVDKLPNDRTLWFLS